MKFFPFDLTGPQFLVFYPVFAIGVAVVVWYIHTRREAALESVLPHLTDPYRIALLRNGRRESVRIAVLSLIERGLLLVSPNRLVVMVADATQSVSDPLEHALLSFFVPGRKPAEAAEGPRVKVATTAMQAELEAQGLLSTARERSRRLLPAVAIPLAVGFIRLFMSTDHPTRLLLLEMIGLALFAALISDQRVTPLGRRTLEHLEALFGQARLRASDPSAGAAGAELTLLAATFGIAALPNIAGKSGWLHSKFASMRETLDFLDSRKRDGSSGCGGGCGGGSGCGGCGGCGG